MPPKLEPDRLTKVELKKQLTKHGIELPYHRATKSVYIKLYKDKVQKRVRFSGFSSEEEEEELPDIRITRSYNKKQMASRNEFYPKKCEVVLEKIIAIDGEHLTGIGRSPRRIKKPLRYIEETEGSQQGSDAEKQTGEEPQTPIEGNEVKVEKIKLTAAIKMVVGCVIVSKLSDKQLRDELEEKGVGVGPVAELTRKLYQQQRLEMLLKAAGTRDVKSANESREYSDQEQEEEIDVEESTPVQNRSRQSILRSSNGDGNAIRRRAREESRQDPPGDQQIDETDVPSSGEKITPVKSERRWIPVWVAILAVVVIAAFLYLVTAMESNPRKGLPHQ